jgi:hypothetical protein
MGASLGDRLALFLRPSAFWWLLIHSQRSGRRVKSPLFSNPN